MKTNPTVQLIFRLTDFTGHNRTNSVVINTGNNATTEQIITNIARVLNSDRNQIVIGMDHSINGIKNVATIDNAKTVDEKIHEQFSTTIVPFLTRHNAIVVVRRPQEPAIREPSLPEEEESSSSEDQPIHSNDKPIRSEGKSTRWLCIMQ
jgi:hypothetical protein